MKKAPMYCSILFLILAINTFSMMYAPQISQYSIIKVNPLSADNITSANVTIDRSIVKRGIESVTITFNNSAGLGWPLYKAKIDLPDESYVNITLANSSQAPNIYSGVFTPSITNKTGVANITVLAVDLSGIIQNEGTLDRDQYIQIVNNLPTVGVHMNVTEIYRGDTLMLNFTPSDVEQPVVDLKWRIALYRKVSKVLITTFVDQTPIFQYNYTVPLSIELGNYYINATCWDNDIANTVEYDLSIINNNPVIGSYGFLINNETVIPTASAIEILRGTRFLLKINATDREGSLSIVLLTITANDPLSGDPLFFPADYANKPLTNIGSNYTINITFPLTTHIGIVDLNIRLFENQTNSEDVRTQKFKIQNNPPVLSNYSLNGLSEGDQIELYEGDWLNFTFSVSDAENSIKYLQVFIQNFATQLFVNYTVDYQGTSTVLRIRANDLGFGDFTAYGYVFDSDGSQDRLLTPIIFKIIEKKVFTPTLWLMFAVGIVLGGIASFIISSFLFKRISPIGETTTPQERKKVREQKIKKTESEEEEIETEEETEEEQKEAQLPNEEEDQGEKKKKFVRKL